MADVEIGKIEDGMILALDGGTWKPKLQNPRWGTPWFIVGASKKGPSNKPVFIRDAKHAREFFGDIVVDKIRKIKRIFNENDPYGEENWEE